MDNINLINTFSLYLKRKNKTKSTISAYITDIKQFSESINSKNFKDVTEDEIRTTLKNWIYNGTFSTKTVSRKLNSIRTFYIYLIEKREIILSPAENIHHPKFRSEKQKILNKNEYTNLIDVCTENLKTLTMIIILLQTGIRIGELSRLKLKDVFLNEDPSYILISPFSSISERKVWLNPSAEKSLKLYTSTITKKNDNYPLFSTKNGKPIQIRNIRASLDKILNKAKLKNYCINDLRNTFIVHQLSQGYSIENLAILVGHKTTITTQRYLSLLKKQYKNKRSSIIPAEL